jgi:hypothetical protein
MESQQRENVSHLDTMYISDLSKKQYKHFIKILDLSKYAWRYLWTKIDKYERINNIEINDNSYNKKTGMELFAYILVNHPDLAITFLIENCRYFATNGNISKAIEYIVLIRTQI